MDDTFDAILVTKEGEQQKAQLTSLRDADLMEGDVTVRVAYSTVNYKDGLALTGKAPIIRRFPLIPGIDFAGTVEASTHPGFHPGDQVVLTGWGVGETHHGGYAQKARVKGDWLVPLPPGLTLADSMVIGTAGLTSMLSVLALERHGLKPDDGPALVTGAAGGVGSVAVAILARLGWHVIASTGRPETAGYLKELGAAEIIDRAELSGSPRPLGKERWAAAIDSVGSTTLANVLSMTRENGAVAACGLAGGMDLPTSVAPFILRGVSLLGINSVRAPQSLRLESWRRLAHDLDPATLNGMKREIGLADVIETGREIVEGKVQGRVLVRLAG